MSDELRGWLEEQRIIAEWAREPEGEIMMALIAKVAELAGALELLVSAARGVPHNGDNLVMGTLGVATEEAESALRAPGGGD